MKAIIMAGGDGTRLRPVSEGMPKPMAPLLGRPLLEHIILLLREHGITDICLTLKYMPERIIERFGDGGALGVRLHYNIEHSPLGTAGGVRECMGFAGNSDFLVISGDAACDFDLSALIRAHRENPCAVTMALFEHPEPTPYGTVLTDPGGRVLRFIEKPEWTRVITDLVNTGIYIVSPRAMQLVPRTGAFDFAKDLFPLLMSRGETLRGVRLGGYWCDIGSPPAYHQCVMDALAGRIKLSPLPGKNEAVTHATAKLIPPYFLSPDAVVGQGATVGPNAAVEGRSVIGPTALISDSVVLDAFVGTGADLSRVTACPGAAIPPGAREEDTVVAPPPAREPEPRKIPKPAKLTASKPESRKLTAPSPAPPPREPLGYARVVACTSRARLMRELAESLYPYGASFDDGLLLKTERGDVRISPSAASAALIVETRARDAEFSRELAMEFEQIVKIAEKSIEPADED